MRGHCEKRQLTIAAGSPTLSVNEVLILVIALRRVRPNEELSMYHKFAFIMHPRNDVRADMGDWLAPFYLVPNWAWPVAFDKIPAPPMITGKVYFPDQGREPAGHLITLPFTPA